MGWGGGNSKSVKELALDIQLTIRDWAGSQIQVMTLVLGLISTSMPILDTMKPWKTYTKQHWLMIH